MLAWAAMDLLVNYGLQSGGALPFREVEGVASMSPYALLDEPLP